MIARDLIVPGIHVPFGRVPLAIGTAGPAPAVMATSDEAVRKFLLDAELIAFVAPGTSGKTFLRALDMMGLHDQVRDRLRPMGQGEPPIAAAKQRSAVCRCTVIADHRRARHRADRDLSVRSSD